MEWQLSRQWVSHHGSKHVPSGLSTSQLYWTASVDYDKVHLVFDRYDPRTSLKESTRERSQGGKPVIMYHVADNTPVGKVSAKQFLSSTTTKDELTVYLAKKVLHHFQGKSMVFIVTARQDVLSNNIDVQHLYSSQKEADTRIILHSLDAARRGTTELYIQSPDTDIFVLAIHSYHQLCKDTYLITGVGNKKRLVPLLRPVAHALGAAKAEALPGFHAFFWSRHSRPICWQREAVLLASTKQMSCNSCICICCPGNF